MNPKVSPAARAIMVLASMGITDPPAYRLDEIAKAQKIRVSKASLPNDRSFSGALLFRGDKRGILLNTVISNEGRINFTFAHELGHHFLEHKPDYQQSGQLGFRCSPKDMEESHHPQEREANLFAVELLMPTEQFRPMMSGAPLDYTLINSLARNFAVSKHACGSRILEFTREACIIIHTRGFKITNKGVSSAARGRLMSMPQIPPGTAAYKAIQEKQSQLDFSEADPTKWLVRNNPGIRLYECTRGSWGDGVATTILKW